MLHYNTLHNHILHYNTLHYHILHYNTLHYHILHYNTLHYHSIHYHTLHYHSIHYHTFYYFPFIQGECDPDFGSQFQFTIHSKELIVGDVFVRIYNEQPTFPLENAKGLTIDLLDFLGSQAQYLHSLMSLTQQTSNSSSQRLRNVEMALEAQRNVIRSNPGMIIYLSLSLSPSLPPFPTPPHLPPSLSLYLSLSPP